MGLIGVTYWQALCDACDDNLCDSGEFSAWSEPDGALSVAGDSGARICVQADKTHLVVCEQCSGEYFAAITDDEKWDETDEALENDDPAAVTAFAAWAAEQLASSRQDSPS